MAAHGTRQRYAEGCRCDSCKAAQAKYVRGWKDRKRIEQATGISTKRIERANGTVVLMTGERAKPIEPQVNPPGLVELAVIEECSGLSIAAERPALVETARTMARILDNPNQLALHPTTSRQLTSILNDLRGQSKKRTRSRLASVQRMVTDSDAAAQ